MINIICEELQNDRDFTDSFSHEHTLLITGEGDSVEITRGRVIPQPDIFTSHEETDNIIIQQTFMAVEQGAECLSVMFDDTDVYILLLHYYNQKEINIPMFMESSVHRRQTTDITATAKEHANLLPNLLAAHGLSGCDTVTPCYGIGKMKILKTLKQGNHSLSCLGDLNANWPDVVKQATSFMLACYGVPKLNSMTQARANQWKTRQVLGRPVCDRGAIPRTLVQSNVVRSRLIILINVEINEANWMVSNTAKLDRRNKQHTQFGVSAINGSRDMAWTKSWQKIKK